MVVTIRYDIDTHTQRYDICRYLKKFYDTIQEYIDQYIDIIILYTHFKQPSTFY